ncbi:uncharacterized protein LOC134208952 [Armigeres subalbatus]|uniref:uncharacterized protein LOC134208952 n=1 Tax=Armigeres subalbatus TaxID=124917 RepID=UPI002ED4A7F5
MQHHHKCSSNVHRERHQCLLLVLQPLPQAQEAHTVLSSTLQCATRSQGLLYPLAEVVEDRNVMAEDDLVNRLPSDLRIQFLEQQEAIELRYLRLYTNQVPALPTTRNSTSAASPFVPIVQCQQSAIPSNRSGDLNVRLDATGIPTQKTNQHPNIPRFRLPPVVRHHEATTVQPQTDNLTGAPTFSHPHGDHRARVSAFVPSTSNMPSTGLGFYPSAFQDEHTAIGGLTLLNGSQIAARHAVPKELPIFTGEPEEWPLFFATFENTTHLCGLTHEENMIRLQRCLKGKALEAVRCQLLYPNNLDQVISTLRMLFGRPEIIVHSLMQKINSLPAPKADRLASLVDFALAVRNMVATVKACDLEEHLCNLTLLQSLTDRLPPMIRLNWATHRQSLRSVTLSEFSEWLYKLAEAASTVTMPQFSVAVDNKLRRGRREDGFLNAHSESTPKINQADTGNECLVCQGSCAAVDKCKRFLSYSLSTRWDTLRKFKICRNCLTIHRGPCKTSKPCGINGCQTQHHRLLHNSSKDKQGRPPSVSTEISRSPDTDYESEATESCNTHQGGEKDVLFQYIPVILYNNGIELHTYALLDSGSSLTLMEEGLAKELELNGKKHPLCLRWTETLAVMKKTRQSYLSIYLAHVTQVANTTLRRFIL